MSNPKSKDGVQFNKALAYTSFVSVATSSNLAFAKKVQVIGPSGEHTCQIELTHKSIRFTDHHEPNTQLYRYVWERVKYLMFYKQELRIKLHSEANNKVVLYCHFGSEDDVNFFESSATLYKFIVKFDKALNALDTILYGRVARFYTHNSEVGHDFSGPKLPEHDNRQIKPKPTKVKSFSTEDDDSSIGEVNERASNVDGSKNENKSLFTEEDHTQDNDFLSNNHDMFDFMKRQEFLRNKMEAFCKDLEDKM